MSNMDRQLLRQKSHQKFAVMKKKPGVSRKIVCFGILIHVLSWRQQKHNSAYVFITEIFWQTVDEIIDDPYLTDVVGRLC